MHRGLSVFSVLAVGACAVAPPSGPSVLAVPGKDKSFAQFQQDDYSCRSYAQTVIGPTTPGQAGTNAAVGTAAAGTVIGAAAGALLGAAGGNAGAGAAIGAGSGLLLGTGVGAANAQSSSGSLQQSYDFAYIQCMTGNGENVQTATAVPYPVAVPYPTYAYTPYYPYPEPYYAPPSISLGFGFGSGYYGRRGYRHGYW